MVLAPEPILEPKEYEHGTDGEFGDQIGATARIYDGI